MQISVAGHRTANDEGVEGREGREGRGGEGGTDTTTRGGGIYIEECHGREAERGTSNGRGGRDAHRRRCHVTSEHSRLAVVE